MIVIGIEHNHNLVYEGDGHYGRAVWPTPVITPAKFAFPSEGPLKAETSSNPFGYRFREDSFDPVSRIRRGRFYCAGNSQPQPWRVSPHPGRPIESIAPDIHIVTKSLETFYGNPIWHQHISGKQEPPLVLLGLDDRFTVWTIIDVEAISTGEDLVTLKARNSFGILPQMRHDQIPEAFQAKLKETLKTFADEVHRASPVSVIDRGRDVVAHALLAYFDLRGADVEDLGNLIKRLESEKKAVAASAANIIARLHARAKPSEQERRELHPIREQDAELVIQCVGTLLCEINFAEWA